MTSKPPCHTGNKMTKDKECGKRKEEKKREEKAAWQLKRYNHALKRSRKSVTLRDLSRETSAHI